MTARKVIECDRSSLIRSCHILGYNGEPVQSNIFLKTSEGDLGGLNGQYLSGWVHGLSSKCINARVRAYVYNVITPSC